MAPDERYADLMFPLGLGYALWQADTLDEYPAIYPGNAGEIFRGKMYPGWKMWRDDENPPVRVQRTAAQKPLRTATVKEVDVSMSLHGSPGIISAGLNVGYQCTSSKGALLAIKDQYAISKDLTRAAERELVTRVLETYPDILRSCDLEDLKDLVVVTGTTMSGDWDAALFESQSNDRQIGVVAGVPSIVLAKTSLVIQHSVGQVVHQSSGHHHQAPQPDSIQHCCSNPPKNQCLFIRTLRLRKRRSGKAPKIIKASAMPKDLSIRESGSHGSLATLAVTDFSAGSESDFDMVVENGRGESRSEGGCIYRKLFDYIFANSSLHIAMVHDRDVLRWRNMNVDPKHCFSIGTDARLNVAFLIHRDNANDDEISYRMAAMDASEYRDSTSQANQEIASTGPPFSMSVDSEGWVPITPPKGQTMSSATLLNMDTRSGVHRPRNKSEGNSRGGRSVPHTSRACNKCKDRKIKCHGNGKDPCNSCVSKGHDCSYGTEDARSPSWNKQTMEAHRNLERSLLATNQALVAQVEALRSYILQHQSGGSSSDINTLLEGQDDLNALCEQTRHLVLQEGRDLALHGDWSPWVNMAPALPAISSAKNHESVEEVQNEDPVDYQEAVYSIPDGWRRYLPDEAILDAEEHRKVCDLFFNFFGSWGFRVVPQLYWRDMFRALQPNAPPSAVRTAHWSPFLQNSLLSVAVAFSDNPDVRARKNRDLFAKKAKDTLEWECTRPTISTVSALSCLGSFHSGQNEHGLGFMYFGISVRMSRALGLNVDCSQWVQSGHISQADEADRHWGFWITYAQDIWWSLYVGREFSINIAHVAVPLPTVQGLPKDSTSWTFPGVDNAPRPRLLAETFVETCKLTLIATKIMDVVYGLDRRGNLFSSQLLHKINAELNDWYSNLPKALTITRDALPHTMTVHLAFWWCIILLHRPSYKVDPSPRSTARKLCLRASRVILDIVEQWQNRYGLRYVPVTTLSVIFSAGTTWLFAASERSHKNDMRAKFVKCAEKCVSYLRETGRLWESGTQLAEMLSRLIQDHRSRYEGKESSGMGEQSIARQLPLTGPLVQPAELSYENPLPVEPIPNSTLNLPSTNFQDPSNLNITDGVFFDHWPPGLTTADFGMRGGDIFPNEPSSHMPLQNDLDWMQPQFWISQDDPIGYPYSSDVPF